MKRKNEFDEDNTSKKHITEDLIETMLRLDINESLYNDDFFENFEKLVINEEIQENQTKSENKYEENDGVNKSFITKEFIMNIYNKKKEIFLKKFVNNEDKSTSLILYEDPKYLNLKNCIKKIIDEMVLDDVNYKNNEQNILINEKNEKINEDLIQFEEII
jgi:hypothetical protein